jgi:hypothetical protein
VGGRTFDGRIIFVNEMALDKLNGQGRFADACWWGMRTPGKDDTEKRQMPTAATDNDQLILPHELRVLLLGPGESDKHTNVGA